MLRSANCGRIWAKIGHKRAHCGRSRPNPTGFDEHNPYFAEIGAISAECGPMSNLTNDGYPAKSRSQPSNLAKIDQTCQETVQIWSARSKLAQVRPSLGRIPPSVAQGGPKWSQITTTCTDFGLTLATIDQRCAELGPQLVEHLDKSARRRRNMVEAIWS